LLTEQHQDVKQAYLGRCQGIEEQREHRLDQWRARQTDLGEQDSAHVEQRNSVLDDLTKRQNQERESRIEPFREQEGRYKVDGERLDVWIRSAGFTEDENRSPASWAGCSVSTSTTTTVSWSMSIGISPRRARASPRMSASI
jgi:hypothetical protein